DHVLEQQVGKKAQVERTRSRDAGLDARVEPRRMNVKLVRAEPERDPAFAVALDGHAEHPGIEVEAAIEVARREHDMINACQHVGLLGEMALCMLRDDTLLS